MRPKKGFLVEKQLFSLQRRAFMLAALQFTAEQAAQKAWMANANLYAAFTAEQAAQK